MQTLERGARASATHVWDDNQFEDGDACELNLIFLHLADGLRRAEVPLLADNFPTLDIEPAFAAGANSTLGWSNKPLTHIETSLIPVRCPAIIG